MSISTSLSSKEIDQDRLDAEYTDDILYSGWNPDVNSVSQQLQLSSTTEQRGALDAPATKVAELFLTRMYSFLS